LILAQTAKMIEDVDAADFSTNSLTVAGNSVTLGSSTEVDYIDLNDTGNSFPIPNADLSNSSVSIAGNNVALGGSTNINYVDLNDTGTSFPIPNSDLGNSSLTVAGNNVVLGGSTSVNHSDISNIDADDHHTRYSDEEAQDAVGTILNADFNYDDGGNSITLASNSLTVGNTTISLGSSGTPDILNLDGSNLNSGEYVKYNGSNLVSSAVDTQTLDNDSITTDSNGDIQVAKPSTIVIGDFETDVGDWNGNPIQSTDTAFNGSGAIYYTPDTGDTVFRDIDFKGVSKLSFYTINDYFNNVGDTNTFRVFVGSTKVLDIDISSYSSWTKVEIDVSSFSGVKELKFAGNDGRPGLDFIKLVKDNTKFDGAGN